MSKQTVKAECSSCRGTGLYSGFCEAEGCAVICLTCDGTGCETISFTPFTIRHRRRDIKIVQKSRGSFIGTGVGGYGGKVDYNEWFKATKG